MPGSKNTPMPGRWLQLVAPAGLGECWLWKGARDKDGYGKFQLPGPKQQISTRAHRWAYEHFIGSIPTGMLVLHTCDNPPCVNPNHLWLGTQQDNVDDRERKGRGQKVWGDPVEGIAQRLCRQGHPLSGSNLRIDPDTGWWRCKRCMADRQREWRERQAAKVSER